MDVGPGVLQVSIPELQVTLEAAGYTLTLLSAHVRYKPLLPNSFRYDPCSIFEADISIQRLYEQLPHST